MLRKLAITFLAVASVGVATIPISAMAAHGGGGHGGGGSHFGVGGRSLSGGPGFSLRGMPGANAFVNRGVAGHPFVGRGAPGASPFVARRVSGDHHFAWIGHRRVLGRHIYGFIPGIGYGYYWYYDDCYVLTDYGWINICGYY